MYNDVVAMHGAWRTRGFSLEDILLLEGKLNRTLLFSLIREVNKRVATWKSGNVFMHYSGHGAFIGSSASEARVGLQLASDKPDHKTTRVFWDEVFTALRLPANVGLILLPDS